MAATVLNTDASLDGKTLVTAEGSATITALHTFDRDPSAPFGVSASSAVVTNLDADKLDGQEGSYYLNPSNLSAVVPISKGGTAAATTQANKVFAGPTSGGDAAPSFRTLVAADIPSVQAMSLIGCITGSTTNTSAEDLATVAISGLTAKDSIVVHYVIESVTQATANVVLRNTTDGVSGASLTASGALASGTPVIGKALMMVQQNSTTAVRSIAEGYGSARVDAAASSTWATAWTGSWNLTIRHGGVTSGGTFRYTVAFYKVAGQ